MESIQVLWVDDEINRLHPHIHFLEKKGIKSVHVQMALTHWN